MKNHVSLVVTVMALAACRGETLPSGVHNIFEDDNRIAADLEVYPYNAIGRVTAVGGRWCTGFLVSSNLVLTNAHCLSAPLPDLAFELQFDRGTAAAIAGVIDVRRGTTNSGNRVSDWAILVLDHDVGEDSFDLDFATSFDLIDPATEDQVRDADTDGPYLMAGYPADRENGNVLVVEQGCEVMGRNADWNYLYHDCDNKTGASGSPIFYMDGAGRAQVVAINSAERFADSDSRIPPEDGAAYAHRIANLATSLLQFVGVREALQDAYPAGIDRRRPPVMVKICNDTNLAVYASLAYAETPLDLRPTAHGWYRIGAHSCQTYSLSATGTLYGFAFPWSSARPTEHEGWPLERDREFCVHARNAFALDSNRNCRRGEADYLMQPFGLLVDEDPTTETIDWTLSPR